MQIPEITIPIIEIPYSEDVQLFIKREDIIHSEISGNKYWKLFYNIQDYLESKRQNPLLITFGGAYSNHISALAALGRENKIPTLGIIRGEEVANLWQNNPTLIKAHQDGMEFAFVTREAYRDKAALKEQFLEKYPDAVVIPEGGSNILAVEGVQHMLDERTKEFDYLCTAVGTGGTFSGLSSYAEDYQQVIGFMAVNDTETENRVKQWTQNPNRRLIDSSGRGYGKITDELIRFINDFKDRYHVPLEPMYTAKMMQRIFQMIDEGAFPKGSKILAFHTGGLQGINGINDVLKRKNKELIKENL